MGISNMLRISMVILCARMDMVILTSLCGKMVNESIAVGISITFSPKRQVEQMRSPICSVQTLPQMKMQEIELHFGLMIAFIRYRSAKKDMGFSS